MIPRVTPLRIKDDHPDNGRARGLYHGYQFAALAEWGETGHYLILNVSTGQVLPGIWHLDRFEVIPEDEL